MAEIETLLSIMARLRHPERGCPWDLEQDFSSISPHTIEEAYEVDEAIASGDLEALRDELGDLLFQVVFQARIAQERGAFDFEGVVEAIVSKLIRRHPHVFAEAAVPETAEAQLASWEEIKAAERAAAGPSAADPADPFEGIPRALPALARCAKILGRLERLSRSESSRDRVQQARAEIDAVSARLPRSTADAEATAARDTDPAARQRWIGEGLRAWVRLARALGVDAEQALRSIDDETLAEARTQQPRTARVNAPETAST